ncbi:hypothetical protein BOX15_Mlig003395g1, partial [Macrostomum lignano]
VTKVFRAAVKALELRKGLSNSLQQQQQQQQKTPKEDLQCNFSTQGRQLHSLIVQARNIVQSAQSDSTESARTTPAVEQEIARMLAACDAGLNRLTAQLAEPSAAVAGPQALAHRREVTQILRERLQTIAASHRAACHRRRRRARLQAEFVPASVLQRRRNPTNQSKSSAASKTTSTTVQPPQPDDPIVESLSPHEKAELQQESIAMLNELTALSGDVKQVESQLTQIASLQRQFGERVLEQEGQIDHIHVETVSSVENVRYGNEQLRKAMQNKASLRFWLLFYLIVTSLTLWFLDWYND